MGSVTRTHSALIQKLRDRNPAIFESRERFKKYADPIGHYLEGRANQAGLEDPQFDPPIPPVIPMPDPDPSSQGSIAARRRSVQAQMLRRGRMSTILTQPQSEPLGG